MATWASDITQALTNLGGVARLGDIYEEVKRIRPQPHPDSLDAIIRGTIEQHSSDSAKFGGKDLFFSVKGLGSGVCAAELCRVIPLSVTAHTHRIASFD